MASQINELMKKHSEFPNSISSKKSQSQIENRIGHCLKLVSGLSWQNKDSVDSEKKSCVHLEYITTTNFNLMHI